MSAIFYHGSIADASVTIDAGIGEDASFPKENLQDHNANLIWKSSVADTDGYIQIDLGSGNARAADSLAIGGSNVTGVKLAYDDADNSGFTAISYVVGSAGAYATFANPLDAASGTAPSAKRYWRVYLEANGDDQEIGCIFIGAKFTLPVRMTQPFQKGFYSLASQRKTYGGQIYSNLHASSKRAWQFGLDQLEGQTNYDDMESFLQSVELNHYPFVMDPDGDGTEYLVRMANNPFFLTEHRYLVHDTDVFIFQEEN